MRLLFLFAALLSTSSAAWAFEAVLSPLTTLPPGAECMTKPDGLPDGCVARGTRDIRSAWLSGPTERYPHGALGDTIEASGLRVELADGRVLSFSLPPEAVFEDLTPRLYDLDGDGLDEVITVKSTGSVGAALVILGVRNGKLDILAEADPIGTANRWLNPVGAGDFDGDGQVEIAYVQTPHIGGILKLVRWNGPHLDLIQDRYGYSNHAIGSRELGLAAIVDADGDGIADLIVPGVRRDTLHVVSFKGGRLKNLAKVELDAPIQSALHVTPGGVTFQLQKGWGGGQAYNLSFK